MKTNSRLKLNHLAAAITLASSICMVSNAFADTYSSPRLRSANGFLLNGGIVPAPASQIMTYQVLDFDVSWDIFGECGELDPNITIEGVFNGVTEGFRNYMDGLIGAATGAVAGLPGLILKRVDPGLYDIVEEGMLSGALDFEAAKVTCEGLQEWALGEGESPFSDFAVNAKVGEWSAQLGLHGYGGPPGGGGASTPPPSPAAGNAKLAQENADANNELDDGVSWVCGDVVGGQGQDPIELFSDVTLVGYNTLLGRAGCDSTTVPSAIGQDDPLWSYWSEPDEAEEFVTSVLGEDQLLNCQNCRKSTPVPGKGLLPQQEIVASRLRTDLARLVNGTTPITKPTLDEVSAIPGALVDDQLIFAIRRYTPDVQLELIRQLSDEIAFARLIEQARLAILVLRTGVQEPNVANKQNVVDRIERGVKYIQDEVAILLTEMRSRDEIASLTLNKIMYHAESRVQSTELPTTRKPTLRINSVGGQN